MKSLALLAIATALAHAGTNAPPAATGAPAILAHVGIDRQFNAQIPLDLEFTDEAGGPVTLRQYFGKPVILALVYYQCPSLCNLELNSLVRSTRGFSLKAGKDFEVVAVSFDPRETAEMATAKKRSYAAEGASAEGWHFLTGEQQSSKALADSVGFHYAYDANTNQYAHPSAIMILTPEGRVSRYFYGIDYPPRDLRLALVEASSGSIGTPVDQVLLYCFHYDPATGKYGLVIMNSLRVGGLLTLAALIGFVVISLRRDFRRPARVPENPPQRSA